MELKPLSHYYGYGLRHKLRDGDNKFIKKYTTKGFKKSYEMWGCYPHSSLQEFFDGFIGEYSEEYLVENCERCLRELSDDGLDISFDDLFDILIRRLVIDAYMGFKCEDVVREKLEGMGVVTRNDGVLSRKDEVFLDTRCGIDIVTYKGDSVGSFIQVKNTSTFSFDGSYIMEKRREFFDKEREANEFVDDGVYRPIMFYIYDKGAFIREGLFKFYVNPNNGSCHFTLGELVNDDGTLKVRLSGLKTRVL